MALFVAFEGSFLLYTQAKAAAALVATPVVVAQALPAPTNMISNPSVEAASSNPSIPEGWTQEVFGKNTTSYVYPGPSSEGLRGIQINMTARTSGNATWQFAPVKVTAGSQYTFSDYYQSNVQTVLEAVVTLKSGALSYIALGTVPAAANWTKKTVSFKIPTNGVSVTVLHEINKVGYLNTDMYSLDLKDTVLPTVSITVPQTNATILKTFATTASASDNVGVAGVQFKMDGVNVNPEVTTAPYTTYIDSTAFTNGTHSLTAVARDAAGNTKTSTKITLNIANVVATPTPTATPTSTPTSTPAPTATPTATSTPTVVPTATPTPTAVPTVTPTATPTPTVVPTVTPTPTVVPTSTPTPTVIPTVTPTATPTPTVVPTVTPTPTVVPTVTPTPTGTPVPTPVPGADNLIANPSLETPGATGFPLNWSHGGWGTNTPVFTYPVAGQDGASAAKVQLTSYTSGDQKWYFTPVTITPNASYYFSDYYNADVPTVAVAEFHMADGSYQYATLFQGEATGGLWKKAEAVFSTPVNSVTTTVYHLINQVGSLSVDNFVLSSQALDSSNQFSQGIVSLTFDDGWLSHYASAMPILDSFNLKGTFYIVSQFALNSDPSNKVQNQSMETDGGNGNAANWNRGNWGTNTATFEYPVTGNAGAAASKITMSGYTDGDAKWYFDDVNVTANTAYHYRDSYLSDVPTTITVRYTLADASNQYVDLVTVPAGAAWQNTDTTFTTPANVVSMTVFHLISANGTLTTDDVTLNKVQDYVTPAQVVDISAHGHEVGAHTRTHADLATLSAADAQTEIAGSKSEIEAMGVPTLSTLAYPFGSTNASIETIAANAGFALARTVTPGYDTKNSSKYALVDQNVENGTSFATIKAWIDASVANKTWLILTFHQIQENPNVPEFGTTPEVLTQVAQYLHDQNIMVKTVKDVAPLLN